MTDELEAFCSYIGSHPEDRETAAAAALLPRVLAPGTDSPTGRLVEWAKARLGRDASVIVDSGDIVRLWPDSDTMTVADVVACAQLLERHGIGLEPDPRLGGPLLGVGPAVLFEARGEVPRAASAEYAVAATVLQLAVAVGGVDGALLAVELEVMLEFLGSNLQLSPAERERLAAHLHWLSATGSRLDTLQREVVGKLPLERRTAIGGVLLAVATSDGIVTPDEVDVLETVFDMLGLDRQPLRDRLAPTTGSTTDGAASTCQPSPPGDGSTPSSATRQPVASTGVLLDEKVLAASAASTAAVASLLGDIFAESTPVRTIVDDSQVYDQLKLMARLAKLAGFDGLLVCLDEMVNLFKLSSAAARSANYEQILRIINDGLQGGAAHLGFLFGGTPDFLADPRRGLYSYPALQSRLAENTFATGGLVDYSGPVLRLANLGREDFFQLLHNLRHIQAGGDPARYLLPDPALEAFMAHCSDRIGDAYFRTPRLTIKAFLDLLAILEYNTSTDWRQLLGHVEVDVDQDPTLNVAGDAQTSDPTDVDDDTDAVRPSEHPSTDNDDDLGTFRI